MEKILVTGACGQLGSELTIALRDNFGAHNVLATDIKSPADDLGSSGPFEKLDVLNEDLLQELVKKNDITQIYHLAAILSAKAEEKPLQAWHLNIQGLINVLETSRENKLSKVFWPSSIAVFGPDTPKDNTPQDTMMNPNTVYGISKLAGERWCEYYFQKYGLDTRSLRYPGLIGYKTPPGGGTTDYAVDIFYKAVEGQHFNCFLAANSYLPMMYMDDAIKATLDLMQAPGQNITIRSSYNVSAISFSPEQLAKVIQSHMPGFSITYQPDFRQTIAESWPNSIDDAEARRDWHWQPDFDLDKLVTEMIKNLSMDYNIHKV